MEGIRSIMGWVTLHPVAIFSALLAAFWAAVGIVVQQRVAQDVPADKAISGTMVTSVVREPLWQTCVGSNNTNAAQLAGLCKRAGTCSQKSPHARLCMVVGKPKTEFWC
jgi:hypothetical protein